MRRKTILFFTLIGLIFAATPLVCRPANAQAIYDVTIWGWDELYTGVGWLNNLPITMDGQFSGFNVPHTFTGLTGTHNFTVPPTDSFGHPFSEWVLPSGNNW